MKSFTGSDAFGYSVRIPAGSSPAEPGAVPAADLTLSWPTFSDAANDAGMSRRYGGIHFRSGDLAGRALGRLIGAAAWAQAQTYFDGRVRAGSCERTLRGRLPSWHRDNRRSRSIGRLATDRRSRSIGTCLRTPSRLAGAGSTARWSLPRSRSRGARLLPGGRLRAPRTRALPRSREPGLTVALARRSDGYSLSISGLS